MLGGELIIPVGDALSFEALQLRLHPADSRVRKLAVEQEALVLKAAQDFDDVWEVPAERLSRFRNKRHVVAVTVREAAKSVPLGLVLPSVALRQLGREESFHWRRH
jgi:hypothetical protein